MERGKEEKNPDPLRHTSGVLTLPSMFHDFFQKTFCDDFGQSLCWEFFSFLTAPPPKKYTNLITW